MRRETSDDEEYTVDSGTGRLRVVIGAKYADKVRAAAEQSRCVSPARWVEEAVEFMLDEYRCGRYRPDPARHSERKSHMNIY